MSEGIEETGNVRSGRDDIVVFSKVRDTLVLPAEVNVGSYHGPKDTYEAWRKNRLGMFKRIRSISLKIGGSTLRSVGFVIPLHAKIIATPKSTRPTARGQPISCRLNGTVPGTGTLEEYCVLV